MAASTAQHPFVIRNLAADNHGQFLLLALPRLDQEIPADFDHRLHLLHGVWFQAGFQVVSFSCKSGCDTKRCHSRQSGRTAGIEDPGGNRGTFLTILWKYHRL